MRAFSSCFLAVSIWLAAWGAPEPVEAYAQGHQSRYGSVRQAPRAYHRLRRKRQALRLAPRQPSLRVDGHFALNTDRAVRQFQARHGIAVTGQVGTITQRALGLPPGPVLRLGQRGRRVSALQIALIRSAYWRLPLRALPLAPTVAPLAKAPALLLQPPPVPARPSAPELPASTAGKPLSQWAAQAPAPPSFPPFVAPPPPRPNPRPAEYNETVPLPVPARPIEVPVRAEMPSDRQEIRQATGSQFELRAADWLVATGDSRTIVDLARPGWNGGFSYWRGNWGLGGGYGLLSDGLQLIDANLRWRDDAERLNLGVGWRGVTQGNVGSSLLAADVGSLLPLYADGPALDVSAGWGLGIPGGLFAEGYLGLLGRLGPLRLRGGYRGLLTTGVTTPNLSVWQGPQLGLTLPL
ncbi:MAG: peptidoglycan-binding domain-containing protein [Candidatus Sericytochromatia bacterium]|nr:peptidoglycan-binding domain-containing protein [Candidatus Sericytochromatia bacterium]